MPVAREVLAHARSDPDRVALALGDGEDVTYAELSRQATRAAGLLISDGAHGAPVRGGEVVAVVPLRPDRGDHPGRGAASPARRWSQTLVALLAVDLVGGVPLVCDEVWGDAQREEVLARVRPDRRVRVADLCAPGGRDTGVPDREPTAAERARGSTGPGGGAGGDGDAPAWAGFTSGSTGGARAVVRTRASWVASFDAVSALSGSTTESVVLVPGSLATSLYCFGAVHALCAGATVRPAPAGSDLGAAARASDVLHVTPAQLEAVLDAVETSTSVRDRTALVGGAELPAGTRRRAEHAGVRVVSYYGAAELSFVAVDTDGTGLRAFPDVEIDVRAAGGDEHGTVWVRSPWVASGYLGGAPGALRRRAGWVTVGDLADLRAPGGPLVLRGRGTGAIAVGASTVLPEDVEAVLATDPGVAHAAVLGTPHPRWGQVVTAVLELAGTDGPAAHDSGHDALLLARLEALCRLSLAPAQRPRRWFVATTLPRTAAGKVARATLADRLPTYRRLRADPRR